MAILLTIIILFASATLFPQQIHGQEAYQRTCLDKHNEFRSRHQNTPSMNMDSDLNNKAAQCASYYAGRGTIDHSCSNKGNAGENLYRSSGRNPESVRTATSAVTAWYNEESQYNYNNGGFSSRTGHFTQVVWVKSTRLGCGYASNSNGEFFVSLYLDPGNFQGQYAQNVMRPK